MGVFTSLTFTYTATFEETKAPLSAVSCSSFGTATLHLCSCKFSRETFCAVRANSSTVEIKEEIHKKDENQRGKKRTTKRLFYPGSFISLDSLTLTPARTWSSSRYHQPTSIFTPCSDLQHHVHDAVRKVGSSTGLATCCCFCIR